MDDVENGRLLVGKDAEGFDLLVLAPAAEAMVDATPDAGVDVMAPSRVNI